MNGHIQLSLIGRKANLSYQALFCYNQGNLLFALIFCAGYAIKQKYNDSITYDYYPTPTDLINAYNNISDLNTYIFDTYTLDANYVRVSQAERIRNNG